MKIVVNYLDENHNFSKGKTNFECSKSTKSQYKNEAKISCKNKYFYTSHNFVIDKIVQNVA